MKKLKLFSGGHPFVIDDVIYHQNGIIDSISGVVQGLISTLKIPASFQQSENVIILKGIELVPSTYDVTSGIAYLDGEICTVSAWTRPELSNWSDWGLIKSESFDPLGSKVYANNQSHDTYSITTGVWVLISTIPQGVNYIPLEDLVSFRFAVPITIFPTLITIVNTSTPDNYISLKKDQFGQIVMYCRISELVMNGANNYTIPVGYRPANDILFVCPTLTFVDKYAICKIATTGIVSFSGHGFTNPSTVSTKVIGTATYYIDS